MKLELKHEHLALSLSMKDCCGQAPCREKLKAGNPENPVDEIGIAHNAGLVWLEKKLGHYPIVIQDDLMLSGYVFEDDVILRAAVEFVQTYPFKNREISKIAQEQAELFIGEIGQWDPRPGDTLLSSEFPPKTMVSVADWMERLKAADVQADLIGFGLSALELGKAGPAQYIQQVIQLEAAAGSADISRDDLLALQGLASIARHSTEFWNDRPNLALSASGPIKSDVKGAASGVAAGFVTGVGIVVGGLLGGLVRSAAYLLASKAMPA